MSLCINLAYTHLFKSPLWASDKGPLSVAPLWTVTYLAILLFILPLKVINIKWYKERLNLSRGTVNIPRCFSIKTIFFCVHYHNHKVCLIWHTGVIYLWKNRTSDRKRWRCERILLDQSGLGNTGAAFSMNLCTITRITFVSQMMTRSVMSKALKQLPWCDACYSDLSRLWSSTSAIFSLAFTGAFEAAVWETSGTSKAVKWAS